MAKDGVYQLVWRLYYDTYTNYVDENFHIEVDDTCKDAALTFDYERIHSFYEINYPEEVSEVLRANMTSSETEVTCPAIIIEIHPRLSND